MNDLLTTEEAAQAALQGWCLSRVFDLASDRWRIMVLGVGLKNAETASAAVINQARSGSALAQKALRLVMKSNQEKKK